MSGHQNVLKDKMEHKTDIEEYRTQASNLSVMLFVCVHEGIWCHGEVSCVLVVLALPVWARCANSAGPTSPLNHQQQ